MKTPNQVKTDFFDYLDQKFGTDRLTGLVKLPPEVRIGERVLYQMTDGQEASRLDTEKLNQENDEAFGKIAAQISEEIEGATFFTEPATSSGLPYPRTIDIPSMSDLALGNLASNYETNHEELPTKDFPVLWLFGAIFGYSSKYLIYLDFTDPRLRALYIAEYDVEHDFSAGRDIPQKLRSFLIRREKLTKTIAQRQDVLWAKLVQTDSLVHTTMKTPSSLMDRVLGIGGYEYQKHQSG